MEYMTEKKNLPKGTSARTPRYQAKEKKSKYHGKIKSQN